MNAGAQLDSIIDKQKKRYSLLRKLYELTDGVETKITLLEAPEGIDQRELWSIIDYLSSERLLKQLAGNAPLVQISHRGVLEIEDSIVSPHKPTEHFLPQVINFYGNVGSVQSGNKNVANVSQNIGDPSMVELLQELRRHLNSETTESKREGNEVLDGLEAELTSNNPNQSRIKFYPKGLSNFVTDTGKSLLVEIGSKIISNQIGLG